MSDSRKVELENEFKLTGDFPVTSYNEWKEKAERDLQGASFEKMLFTGTYEGITLKPVYTKSDIENTAAKSELPGFSNFSRGARASGYKGKSWEIAQEIKYGDADEFNRALTNDLQRGQTSINMPLDTATKLGLDADYAGSDQVGDTGLSISGLSSFSRALYGIDLEKYPLHIDAGFSAVPVLTLLNAYAQNNNINLKKITGSISADPVGFLALNSRLPVELDFTFDSMKISLEWAGKNAAGVKTIGVSGFPFTLAGASAVQELAYVMATAVEYLNRLIERGVSVNDAAGNMRFTFSIGSFYFMEIAKLRASRVLWSNMLDVFGADDTAKKMEIHAKTSLNNQTIFDPYVNLLRTTTEAFSAIVGGVDSLHTNPFNESFAVPGDFARRIARNTQIILDEESHLSELIDPAGGSYYVESLTREVADAAWNEFRKIEEMGGIIRALKSGYLQNQIESVVAARIKDIKKRKKVIVGTNMYVNPKESKPETVSPGHDELYTKRAKYLQEFRVESNLDKNKDIVEKLNSLVEINSDECINIGTEALLAGATLGEISHAARAKTDESISIEKLNVHSDAELFVELRNHALDFENKTGSRPKVFLACMGPLKQYKARADFSRSFFEVGGFEVVYPQGFESSGDAVKAALDSGAGTVVLCSTDETYPGLVKPITEGIKNKQPRVKVILAGYPKDRIESYKNAGVDNFIYLGADAYAVLSDLLSNAGGGE